MMYKVESISYRRAVSNLPIDQRHPATRRIFLRPLESTLIQNVRRILSVLSYREYSQIKK